jgi:hypothetical protein
MNTYSIYIPRANVAHDENFFKEFFDVWFGIVSRVDFVALDAAYSSNGHFRKAFVHFHVLFTEHSLVNEIVTTLNNNEPYRLYTGSNQFIICLKNKVPVPTTTLNIHQLAENNRFLEEKTKALEEKMKALEEALEEKTKALEEALEEKTKALEDWVAKQDDMLDRAQQTIYQMIPKLNMSESEARSFDRVLYGFKEEHEEEEHEDDEDYDCVSYDERKEWTLWGHYNKDDDGKSFDELEKKYGKLKYNKETHDFTDCDGFVRYVINGDDLHDVDEFGGPFVKYADVMKNRDTWKERIEKTDKERMLLKVAEKKND